MPILLLIIGIILRSIAPWLFYIIAIAFLAFLVFTVYAEIKDGTYDWKKAIATSVYIIITLVLMFA